MADVTIIIDTGVRLFGEREKKVVMELDGISNVDEFKAFCESAWKAFHG